jgi:hypothetical protein
VQPGPGRQGYAGTGGGKQESLRVLKYLETLPQGTELSIQDIVQWSKKNKTEVGISSLYKNLNTPERLASPDLKKRWQNVNKKLKINIRPQFILTPTEENFKKLGKLLNDKSLTKDHIKRAFGLKPKSSTESFNNLLKAYEKSRGVKIPDTRFKPYRHKGTELAEKIVKTFKANDTMTITALTEEFFPGRPEQNKSVIKILKEAGVREPQPLKKLTGPKTTEQIMAQRRRDKLKEKSVPAYEKKIRGTKNTHLHHMMSKRFNVTTRNLGYAPPRVNAELLPKVEGVLESLYKKRENLLKKRPVDLVKQLEDINVRGMNIVSDPKVKGYLNFKIMDPKTLKMSDHGVDLAKTIDPLDLLEGKAIKDLTQADKDLIELNRTAIMKKQKGPPIEIKNITKLIRQLGCGLYSGGRVAFANGTVDCFGKGLEKIQTKNIVTRGDAAVMKKIIEVGAKKGAARTALMWLGPFGVGGDVLFEAGDIAVQMLGGKPLDESLRSNWITGAFIDQTEKEARDIKLFEDTGPGAKTYVQGSEAYEKLQKMYKALQRMKQKQVRSRSRGKEITDADIKKMEEDVAAQERYTIMLDKKESAFIGGAGQEEYQQASDALEDKRGAASWATEQKLKYREDQPTSDRYKSMNIDISLPSKLPDSKQFDTVEKMAEFFIDDDMWNYYKDYGWKDKTELFTEARKQDPKFNKKVWHNVMNYGDVGIKGTQDSFFRGTYDRAPTGPHFAGGGIAGIRRPWAIPPESGPRPGYQQGNRVNPFEETGNLPGGAYEAREYIKSPIRADSGITTVEAPPKEDKRTFDEIIESVVGKAKDRPKHYKLDEEGNIITPRAGLQPARGMGGLSMETLNRVIGAVDAANLSKEKSDYFWNKFGIEFGLSGNELKPLKKGKKFLNKENIPLISLDEDTLLSFTKGLDLPGNTAATIFAESNLGGDINATLELANKNFKTTLTKNNVSWYIKPTFKVGEIGIAPSVKGTDNIIEKIKLAVGNPNWSIEGELIKAQKRKETGGAPDQETQKLKAMLMADPRLWRLFGGSRGMMQMFGDTMTEEEKGDIFKLSGEYTFDNDFKISPSLETDLLTNDITYGLGLTKDGFSSKLKYDDGLTGSVAYGPVRVGSTGDGAHLDFNHGDFSSKLKYDDGITGSLSSGPVTVGTTGDGARLDFNKDMGNFNLKAKVDTEGNWFIGPSWSWGKKYDMVEGITEHGQKRKIPKTWDYEGTTIAELKEALQPKKLYARGGLASLNNYATKRTE